MICPGGGTQTSKLPDLTWSFVFDCYLNPIHFAGVHRLLSPLDWGGPNSPGLRVPTDVLSNPLQTRSMHRVENDQAASVPGLSECLPFFEDV
jgi:hypothetical protein